MGENAAPVRRKRRCIVCGAQDDKMHLHRFVRTAEGAAFDPTGRVAGRGAYVCSSECFEKARKAHKLERALRMALNDEDYGRLSQELDRYANQRGKNEE